MQAEQLDFLQLTVLALIQGVTEFLPVSSSAHLILPATLLGWPDQGLTFDVAVHVGSLVAVLAYLQQEVRVLCRAWLLSLFKGQHTESSRLAWLLILATLPAGIAGLLFNDWIEAYTRFFLLIAITSIVAAALLLWADQKGRRNVSLAEIGWKQALLIGAAQALALIPGTSRSGITMTAALFCHLNRREAARFSFLMAIPIILASGLLRLTDFTGTGNVGVDWVALAYGALVAAVTAFICIHFFIRLIERMGFLPFVIYRALLGILLFGLYWLP